MSSTSFLIIAIIVFSMMLIGIFLTIKEFSRELEKEKRAKHCKNGNEVHYSDKD